jgi:general L-amino acid transport system substrate-binding protein
MRFKSVLVAALAALSVAQPGCLWAQSSRLEVVKARGVLLCGVNPGFAGFSLPDSAGQWHGFDIDICRAVAAAVLGDDGKVKYVPLSAKDRFTALQSGEVDVLARNATWTLTRNAQLGVNFIGTNFYDGQAFMVTAASKITSVRDLDGASICVISGTDTVRTLSDYFRGLQ